MHATKSTSGKTGSPRFTLVKRLAEAEGIPYTSARDAHFRGELPVTKLGRNEKYQRWYVEKSDWEKWLSSRKEVRA